MRIFSKWFGRKVQSETPQPQPLSPEQEMAQASRMFKPVNPFANPDLAKYLAARPIAQEALDYERRAYGLRQSLKLSDEVRPITILNFNPVPLKLDGGIREEIPSVIDDLEIGRRLEHFRYSYGGVLYRAVVRTISEPIIFPFPIYVTERGGESVVSYAPHVCKPVEIAHCFLTEFSRMGGVVAFEGGRILIDARTDSSPVEIRVPNVASVVNRENRIYYTTPTDLDRKIRAALDQQRAYCEAQLRQANAFWSPDPERGAPSEPHNIHNIHRLWSAYAITKGWIVDMPGWQIPKP